MTSRWLNGGVALIALAAASTAQAATEVRVIVSHYSDQTAPIFEGMAKDFEAAHPDIDIVIEDVAWGALQQRLTTDIAGGTAPDISIIGTRWLVDFVDNDIVEPLSGYMSDEFKERFIGTFMSPSTIDGEVYGLPVAASARAMYYNKDLFEKAGVGNPPKNWDELADASKKISDLGDDIYGFGLQGGGDTETDAYWYYSLWSEGGDIIVDGKSGIASDAAIKAANIYKNLIDSGLTQPSVTNYNRQDVESLLKQGKVGMILSGPWLRGQLKEESPDLQYGITAIPEGTQPATYGVTDSIVMFASSQVKQEAWQFLEETAFSDKWRREFTLKEGFLPVFNSVAADPHFADDPELKAFTDMLPYAHFAPLVANWQEIADTTKAALQKIYLGESDSAAALGEAAQKIDGILD
ncbi:MAG: sugar ABC transporter substrate-binding protein [Geminicoccaceae bacterium]|nr:sugar ABC transporter substrate-binding protein [Geminicoccaceae bacterium]